MTDQLLAEFRRLLADVDGITSISAEDGGVNLTVETTLPYDQRDAIYEAETKLHDQFPGVLIDFRVCRTAVTHAEAKAEWTRDPEFRREYERLGPVYEPLMDGKPRSWLFWRWFWIGNSMGWPDWYIRLGKRLRAL